MSGLPLKFHGCWTAHNKHWGGPVRWAPSVEPWQPAGRPHNRPALGHKPPAFGLQPVTWPGLVVRLPLAAATLITMDGCRQHPRASAPVARLPRSPCRPQRYPGGVRSSTVRPARGHIRRGRLRAPRAQAPFGRVPRCGVRAGRVEADCEQAAVRQPGQHRLRLFG